MAIKCPYCGNEHSYEEFVCPSTGKELSPTLRLIGKQVGKYRISRFIGEGGMGVVFEARHAEIEKKVALKLLRPKYARDKKIIIRFVREARAAAEIGHENIVEIHDIGWDNATGSFFLVMELLKGRTLQSLINEKRSIPAPMTVDIMLQIFSALHASHSIGIVHRDLKPENIFLTTRAGRKNWVKILDFGIVRLMKFLNKTWFYIVDLFASSGLINNHMR